MYLFLLLLLLSSSIIGCKSSDFKVIKGVCTMERVSEMKREYPVYDSLSVVEGYVYNIFSQEAEPYCGITILGKKLQHAVADVNGYFKLLLPPGNYRIKFLRSDVPKTCRIRIKKNQIIMMKIYLGGTIIC